MRGEISAASVLFCSVVQTLSQSVSQSVSCFLFSSQLGQSVCTEGRLSELLSHHLRLSIFQKIRAFKLSFVSFRRCLLELEIPWTTLRLEPRLMKRNQPAYRRIIYQRYGQVVQLIFCNSWSSSLQCPVFHISLSVMSGLAWSGCNL